MKKSCDYETPTMGPAVRRARRVKARMTLIALVALGAWTDAAAAQSDWSEQTVLHGTELNFSTLFGVQVALDGDTAIVTATDYGGLFGGDPAAHVFVRSGGRWRAQSILSAPASFGQFEDYFGIGVALDGDTALVGAQIDDVPQTAVFVRNGEAWSLEDTLRPSDDDNGSGFGGWVAVQGDTAVVSGSFATFVFSRNSGVWAETAVVAPSGAPILAGPVALDGNTLAMRAIVDGEHQRAVYVFERDGNSWLETATLTSSDPDDQNFGGALALDGDALVIGQPGQNQELAGKVYVFRRSLGAWAEEAQLSSAAPSNVFGVSVAAQGERAIVLDRSAGLVHVFERGGTTWSETDALPVPTITGLDGQNLALDGNTLIAGSPGTRFGAQDYLGGDGAVFVYDDSDADGIADEVDACPNDRDNDIDHDGLCADVDACPTGKPNDADGDQFCAGEAFYFSTTARATLGTGANQITAENEDIVRFDEATNRYTIFFDGSQVGLAAQDVDAFHIREDGSILLSFAGDNAFTLAGVGSVEDEDVVRFVPTSTGSTTAGSFQPFFVGDDHGLTAAGADVDGVYEDSLGRLYLSLRSALTVGGLAIADEDIVRWRVTQFGNAEPMVEEYSMIFRGANVLNAPGGPNLSSSLAIDAFDFQADGSLLLSFNDYPENTGIPGIPATGVPHNVVRFVPALAPESDHDLGSYGPATAGNFQPYFIGQRNAAPLDTNMDAFQRVKPFPDTRNVYQAEAASFGGGSTLDSDNAGFVGSGFINPSATGGFIEFRNVHGGVGGPKLLRFRNALGASSSRTGRLIVNGVSQNVTFEPTGAWTTWTVKQVTVNLAQGPTNTIRLETFQGRDLANIDQLEIGAIYEAENAVLQNASVDSDHTGFSGTGFVNSAASGGSIEFRWVDGASGSIRLLRFRAALGASSARRGRLFVNDSLAGDVTFPTTGSWNNWTYVNVPVALANHDVNVVRLETIGSGDLPNIDRLEVE